jgi:hypothetical protein|nr:MAG TPA: hypothetical protein [Caudoviricetes sp.]
MIISETVKIDDKNYTKTASDSGYYIERNGIRYVEAIDPLGSGMEYTETDILIETEPETTEAKLEKVSAKVEKISADLEYLAMMTDTDLEN